jgi:hypothetical protein
MKRTILFLAVFLIPVAAQAKISDPVWQAITDAYTPAVWSEQLESAYRDPDAGKFRNYVVVMVGGMAAERAERFISWGNYDYRGVKIDAEKGTVKNRRGKVYTFLQSGDVMAVAALDKLGNTVSIKLISPEVYMPLNRANDKKFSRVTDTVQIKLPKVAAEGDDPQQALSMMAQYLKPFSNIQSAKNFSATSRNP